MWRITEPTLDASTCAPFQQEKGQEGEREGKTFNRLSASPGSTVTGSYKENGHISLPFDQYGTMSTTGNIQWFGTLSHQIPTLAKVLEWPEYAPGENQPGFALSGKLPFDDGECYEDNPTFQEGTGRVRGKGCESSFTIPEDLPTGQQLTVFWVWDFSGKVGDPAQTNHVEWYTSCMDIDLVSAASYEDRGALEEVVDDIPEKWISNDSSVHDLDEIIDETAEATKTTGTAEPTGTPAGNYTEDSSAYNKRALLQRSVKFAAALRV